MEQMANLLQKTCDRVVSISGTLLLNMKQHQKAHYHILIFRTCCQYENKQVEIYNKESKKTMAKAKLLSPKFQVQNINGVAIIDFLSEKNDRKDKFKKKLMKESKTT